MSFLSTLNDRCTIQNRTVDSKGDVDNETWKPQERPTPCRVMKIVNRRRTSPDSAEKMQYGTFVFTNIVLSKKAVIAIHDRIDHGGRMYDVLEVVGARDARGLHHQVAICDVRA